MIKTSFIGIPYAMGTTADQYDGFTGPMMRLDADRLIFVTEDDLEPMIRPLFNAASALMPASLLTIPGGDKNKRLSIVEDLATDALGVGCTRASVIVAAGGGYVGNLAGLTANLLYRGVRLVHVPTTLLHMSDGVLSIKQAVNTSLGKNQLGSYYTPTYIWANVDYLRTLPEREILSSMCESTKNSIAIVPDQMERTQGYVAEVIAGGCVSSTTMLRIIDDSIKAKDLVMHDDHLERHAGLICEYGHTVGHAVEAALGGDLPHGMAIAFGMRVAADVAVLMGIADPDLVATTDRLTGPLIPGWVRGQLVGITADQLMEIIRYDNKRGYRGPVGQEVVDMILLSEPGVPYGDPDRPLTAVPKATLRDALVGRLGR